MESRISDTVRLAESSVSTPLNETRPSVKVREQLEKLKRWRVDASRLKIVTDGPRAEGGYGVVCRALLMVEPSHSTGTAADGAINPQRPQDMDVAVKMMKIGDDDDSDKVLRRAIREADIITNLNHQNIVKLSGFVEDLANEEIYLIFPWAEMGDLRGFIASEDWSIPERIWLIYDVACGVEHLHSQNPPVCHGDLKSINILVNSECRAIITDFGSARRLNQDEQAPPPSQRTRADDSALSVEFCPDSNIITITGPEYTLRWGAPELLEEEDAGTPADIWSMGWVFYEIMTGSIPFETLHNDAAIIMRIVEGEFPPLKDHNRMSPILSLVSLMMMCWKIASESRPSAERCRKYVSQMAMCTPHSRKSPTTALDAATRLFHEGQMYTVQNDYDKALAAFNDALKGLDDQARRITTGGSIQYAIAEVHRARHEYDEAAALYAEVVQIREDIGDRPGKADAQWALAEVHRGRGENDEAMVLHAEVIRIREELGDRRGKAYAQFGLAETHQIRHEYDEAAVLYAEAASTFEEIGDRRWKAAAQKGLATIHVARCEYDEAAVLFAEVVRIREDIGDQAGKAEAQFVLSEIFRLQHQYDEAAVLYAEVISIHEETGDRRAKAYAQFGLAFVHHRQDEYDEAAVLYAEVIQIREDIGDRPGKAEAQWGLAEVHRARGEYDEATALYTENIRIREEIGDREGKADAQFELADVHQLREQYDEAAALYAEAASTYEEIGNQEGTANAKRGLAEVHRARKEYAESRQLLVESSRTCRACGDRLGLACSLEVLAGVYDDQGCFKDAIQFYEEAAEVYTEIGLAEEASNALERATDARRKVTEVPGRD